MNALHWVVAAAVLLPSPAGNAWDWRSGPRKLLWNRIPPAGLADIRFGGVDRDILEHPHELIRRRTQRELNQGLRRAHPATVAKLDRLRRHLELLGIPGADVDLLWPYLGK